VKADLSCLPLSGRHQRGSRRQMAACPRSGSPRILWRAAAREDSAKEGLGQRGESGDRIVSDSGEQLDSNVVSAGIQMLGET